MRSAIFRIETLLVALGDEQVARRVENGLVDSVAVAFLAFFQAHLYRLRTPIVDVNSVQCLNGVKHERVRNYSQPYTFSW